MLFGAYRRVNHEEQKINDINVFPVPDKDTGSNLAHTLKGIHDALREVHIQDIQTLRKLAVDGALLAASGNVGIIITGFLSGFMNSFSSERVTKHDLVVAFSKGSDKAYESVQIPKKGTILDVMSSTSEWLQQLDLANHSIETLLQGAIVTARQSLEQTRASIRSYSNVNVVDAGGYGFVLMLEGFISGLHDTQMSTSSVSPITPQKKHAVQNMLYRYEVVSLLENLKKKKDDIVLSLASYGDCLDIVEVNDKMKIHIHTDDPDEVVDLISQMGSIIQMKTADMTNEKGEASQTKSIGVVTDDSASLPLPYLIENDVSSVPFQITWTGAENLPGTSRMNLYEKMRTLKDKYHLYGWPKTSQPSPKHFLTAYQDQLKKYTHVICIPLSSNLSGAYNSAVQAKNMLDEEDRDRVFVLDLKQASTTQASLVFCTVSCIKKGYDIHQTLRQIHKETEKSMLIATARIPDWLEKGGRLSRGKSVFLKLLMTFGLHPILGLKDGAIALQGVSKRRHTLAETMFRYVMSISRSKNKPLDVVIHHGDNQEQANDLKLRLEKEGFRIISENILSPVLGVHTGPDSLIISLSEQS